MDKLVDILAEHAKKRWTLVSLFLVPGFFWLSQAYFSLSFRETIEHWSFLLASGLTLTLAGVLDCKGYPQKVYGLIPWAGLTLCGVVLSSAGLWQLRSPSLPSDRLVVAIAQFSAVSLGAKEEAKNVTHRIYREISKKRDEGSPIEVKFLAKEVVGDTEKARQEKAMQIIRSRGHSAHVILWGDVRKDENELYVEPRLSMVTQLGAPPLRRMPMMVVPSKRTDLREFVTYEPEKIRFKKRLSQEVADIVTFSCGLACLRAGKLDRALELLGRVTSNEALLYRALSFFEKATVDKSESHLRSALELLNRICDSIKWDESSEEYDLCCVAFTNRAFVLHMLVNYSPSEQTEDLLMQATDAYQVILHNLGREGSATLRAGLEERLGNCLYNLGIRNDGEQGTKLLTNAADAYQRALQLLNRDHHLEQWAWCQGDLGYVFCELGARVKGKNASEYLNKAIQCANKIVSACKGKDCPDRVNQTAVICKHSAILLKQTLASDNKTTASTASPN